MTKEFIPYGIASILKELGFDEPCIGFYNVRSLFVPDYKVAKLQIDNLRLEKCCLAPTFAQAFRWFRDIHGLYHTICPEFYRDGINFNWQILWYLPKEEWTEYVICDGTVCYGDNGEYPSQEEAELACLKKLIEICNTHKQ
jgi:hypothetical protein